MDQLDALHDNLFGRSPVTRVYYAEPQGTSCLLDLMHESSVASLPRQGLSPAGERVAVASMYPVLLIEFKVVFDCEVASEDIIAYVSNATDGREVEYDYQTFYGGEEAIERIKHRLFEHLIPRHGIGCHHDEGAEFLYTARPGDRFLTAVFAHSPVPGTRYVA